MIEMSYEFIDKLFESIESIAMESNGDERVIEASMNIMCKCKELHKVFIRDEKLIKLNKRLDNDFYGEQIIEYLK